VAHDVFISYAAQDKPIADAVCGILEGNRIRCWIAPRDVLPGVQYGKAIIDAINIARVIVIVFSSSANGSPHVTREVERALNKGIPILPFRVEDVVPSNSLEYLLAGLNWLDALTPPMESHIRRLAGTVVFLLSPTPDNKMNVDLPSHPPGFLHDFRSQRDVAKNSRVDPVGRKFDLSFGPEPAGDMFVLKWNTKWQNKLSTDKEKKGDVLAAKGRWAGALELFRASLEIHEQLVTKDPDNAKWQRKLAASHEKIGNVLVMQGNLAEAHRAFQVSLEIRKHLAVVDPENAVWLRDLSLSHEKVGDVLLAQGKLAEALGSFVGSLEIRERLASQNTSHAGRQRDLSVILEKIGDVLAAQGKLAEAHEAFMNSLEIQEGMESSIPEYAVGISVIREKIGDVLVAMEKIPEALEAFKSSLDIRGCIVASDTENIAWKRNLWVINNKIGGVHTSKGDSSGALSSYRASLEIAERLFFLNPGKIEWQHNLSESHIKIGEVLVSQGDFAGARLAYRAGLEMSERLVSSNPGNTEWQRELAYSYFRLGTICFRIDAPEEAFSCMRRCYELLRDIGFDSAPMDPKAKGMLDKVTELLGER